MKNMHVVQEIMLTFEKKSHVLILLYLDLVSIKTRFKWKKSTKSTLNCYNLQVVFNNKTRLGNDLNF